MGNISALGLRHVAHEVPIELMAPFVSAAVDAMADLADGKNQSAEEGFRWSLTLVAKILSRTISEGSTIVMKAINGNQAAALQKAIAASSRAMRAMELLEIRVGTESISPLYWAIESGSLVSAEAMLKDLLTIRADRSKYYYGCEEMFHRHPDLIKKLSQEAPGLLPVLFDGLMWRQRTARGGIRRVNYYIRHLIQTEEGKVNPCLKWLALYNDPKLIVHPAMVFVSDIMWHQLVLFHFVLGRAYFLFTLLVFAASQAVLANHGGYELWRKSAVFGCRTFIYLGSMCYMLIRQLKFLHQDIKQRRFRKCFGTIAFPEYLTDVRQFGYLLLTLTLLLMCWHEPLWWCLPHMYGDFENAGLFTTYCPEGREHEGLYSVLAALAMMLYCVLLTDFCIVNMRISAFFLSCRHVFAEFGLFLLATGFLVIAFGLSLTILTHQAETYVSLPEAISSLLSKSLGIYPSDELSKFDDNLPVMVLISLFMFMASIFLFNFLVAQLSQAYHMAHEDMPGYARLNRIWTIVEVVARVPEQAWRRFLESLHFEEPLEFNEGDVGISGGIQVLEHASLHPTTVDTVHRHGGSTSPTSPWPEEEKEEDRLERLERLLLRVSKGKKSKGQVAGPSEAGSVDSSGL
ncbi:unnamed protein product [Effrenium voratum]|nr:unnamed protein product [Effrenium voratum]